MTLQIRKSTAKSDKPYTLNMLVYGHPGVGKTTLAASGPGTLIADAEGGSKLLGASGVACDIADIDSWNDIQDLYALIAKNPGAYQTVVIDPLGELVDKLIQQLKREGYTNGKGDGLSLPGWGVAKERFRHMVRAFRDAEVNLILVSHSAEKTEEDATLIRPKLPAHLDEDVCAMMDVVGFMTPYQVDKTKSVRRIFFTPTQKFYAKQRGSILPDFMDDATFADIKDTVDKNPGILQFYTAGDKQALKDETFLPEDPIAMPGMPARGSTKAVDASK